MPAKHGLEPCKECHTTTAQSADHWEDAMGMLVNLNFIMMYLGVVMICAPFLLPLFRRR